MADPNDLTTQIQTAAGGPASVHTTAASVTNQPLSQLIAADKYLAAKEAAGKKRRGIRFNRFIGPAQCPAARGLGLNDPNVGAY